MSRRGKILSTFVRACFALFVLGVLLRFVDTSELLDALSRLNVVSITTLLLLAFLMIWASCLKWQVFLRAYGHDVGVWRLMKLYTIGYFINTFFPSYIGGDVTRSYHLGRYLKNQKDAAVSTFLERFTGLLAMAFLGLLFVLIGDETTRTIEYAVGAVALATGSLALICFSRGFRLWTKQQCRRVFSLIGVDTLSEVSDKWFDKLDGLLGERVLMSSLFWKAMGLSLLFHVLTVINTYATGWAIGWHVEHIGALFVVVPLILLVGMIPITPSGLGIQEGAFVFFLQRCGATQAEGFGVGIVLRAKIMIISMVGGLLLMGMSRREEPHVAQTS